MSEPRVNVDHFYHRPTGDVVGPLTGKPEIPAISAGLESAGTDVAAVEILCSEQGARILDQDGLYHGLQARMVRALQRFGYAGTTPAIYHAALRDGDLLLHVPVRHADRQRIAALLQRHQAHDLGYFGPGTFEQFPIRADLDLPPEQLGRSADSSGQDLVPCQPPAEETFTPGYEVRPGDSPAAEPAHTDGGQQTWTGRWLHQRWPRGQGT